jgi:lipopolysaccharide/colanic/teichoic acid biosynthesis glycosyltransferase
MVAPNSTKRINDLQIVDYGHTPLIVERDRLKRAFDLTLGIGFFLAALPLIAMIWFVVRLTSSGPGFYSQLRVGRHGRHYRIYKIRTMYHDCERKTGAQWCVKRDPRVTPLGRILRKLHLDELPQIWNVLRGDMSLVGPRPERPEFVGPLSAQLPGYTGRHAVRPGVTGLAQIQLPADTTIECVQKKLVLDHRYVSGRTLWLDTRIILGTAVYICGCSYANVRRLMRLPNPLVHDSIAFEPICPSPRLDDDACVEWAPREIVASNDDSTVCGKA